MIKHIYIIAIVLCFYRCISNRQVVGKYADSKNPDSFQFNSDSTFIYQYRAYHAFEYATGNWKMNSNSSNSIILNSRIQNIIIPSTLTIENEISNQANVILTFKLQIDGGKISDYQCEIFINDTLFDTRRADAINELPIYKPVNTILLKIIKDPLNPSSTYFPLLPLTTEKFNIARDFGVGISIAGKVDDKLFGYHVFSNEVIKLKNKGIKRYYLTSNRWRTINKVSDDSNIFINQ